MPIPEEFKSEIIENGISFLRTITEAFGSDEGLKLWDTIANTLDPDIKGEILFAMLTGRHSNQRNITLNGLDRTNNFQKINAIKEIRAASGVGLNEAKNLVEMAEVGNRVTFTINSAHYNKNVLIHTLRGFGVSAC